MAEGLVGDQQLVGEWDGGSGLWLVRAWVPGPAGSAGLVLDDGIEVDVDVASPGVMAGLSVDGQLALQAAQRAALQALLGDAASAALLAIRGEGPTRLPTARAGRRGRDGLHLGIGRAALARAAAATAPPLARGVALLEASAAAATVGIGGLLAQARLDAEEGGRIVLELAGSGGLRLDHPRTARELTAALRRAATLLGARPDLVDLAAQVDAGRYGPRPQAAAADAVRAMRTPAPALAAGVEAMTPMPAAAPARLRVVKPVPVDRSSLPAGVVSDQVAAVMSGTAEVEVQLTGAAGRASGWWARATAPDGTTLALAPVVDVNGDAVARLLVPPATVGTLEVDLTAEPGAPRPSARVRAVERAVRLGQQAARASRLGLPAAASRWTTCAQAWTEAGDEVRAARAADGARAKEAGPALVVDHLLEG